MERASAVADELSGYRGRVATLDAGELAELMGRLAESTRQ